MCWTDSWREFPTTKVGKIPMVVINTIVLILAVTWIAMAFFNTYVRLRAEDTVSLPAFALTMMFTLGVVVLLLLGFAPDAC